MPNDTAASFAMLYLFYAAEHQISDVEYARFDRLGGLYEGFKEAKDTIIAECENILTGKKQSSGFSPIFSSITLASTLMGGISENRTEQEKPLKSRFDRVADAFKVFLDNSRLDRDIKYRVLWWFSETLYRYQAVSENRKTLLNLWVENGKINTAVADEMRDTAQTVRSLEVYKQWLSKQDQTKFGVFNAEVDTSFKDTIESITTLITVA
jgi:hypothetical protein